MPKRMMFADWAARSEAYQEASLHMRSLIETADASLRRQRTAVADRLWEDARNCRRIAEGCPDAPQ